MDGLEIGMRRLVFGGFLLVAVAIFESEAVSESGFTVSTELGKELRAEEKAPANVESLPLSLLYSLDKSNALPEQPMPEQSMLDSIDKLPLSMIQGELDKVDSAGVDPELTKKIDELYNKKDELEIAASEKAEEWYAKGIEFVEENPATTTVLGIVGPSGIYGVYRLLKSRPMLGDVASKTLRRTDKADRPQTIIIRESDLPKPGRLR